MAATIHRTSKLLSNNCPSGDVVLLSVGTFTIGEGNSVAINKSITVRGSGACAGTQSGRPHIHPHPRHTALSYKERTELILASKAEQIRALILLWAQRTFTETSMLIRAQI